MPQLQNNAQRNVEQPSEAANPLAAPRQSSGANPDRLPSFTEARNEFTRGYLSQILQITGGNVSQAAKLAKRNRTDFYKLLGRYLLLPGDFKIR